MCNDNEIKNHIKNLQDTIITAYHNYEIWWIYKSKDTRPIYLDVMNKYLAFFSTSIHAHFVAMIVALYRLYETRKDTINIPGLIKLIKEGGYLREVHKVKIDNMI